MANEWMAVIGTLAGVAVGGGLTFLKDRIQYNRQLNDEIRKLRRAKMEELYLSLYELDSITTDYLYELLRLRELKMPVEDAFPIVIGKNRELMQHTAKAGSLQAIYAPELGTKLRDIVDDVMDFTLGWQDVISGKRSFIELEESGKDIASRLNLLDAQLLELIHSSTAIKFQP